MANTIISLTRETLPDVNLEVYSDISLFSKPAVLKYKSILDVDENGALSAELSGYNPNRPDELYIIDDDGKPVQLVAESDNETSRNDDLLFFTHTYSGNIENARYNLRQKLKARYTIQKNINVKAILQSLHNIFTWQQGERILNPEFGSRLREYLYEGITEYNKEQIVAEVRRCVTEWEPRVSIVKVVDMTSAYNVEDNTVVLDIIYTIPTLSNEQYNYTYVYQQVL